MKMDPIFVKAYKLLFSNEPDSAEQLRCMLENALKQRYGTHITLSSALPVMTETEKASKQTLPSLTDSGGEESDDSSTSVVNSKDDKIALDLLQEDLICLVCKQITVGANNHLVECLECHSLYHQECHDPPITDTSDPRLAWYCATCKKRMAKELASIKSTTLASSSKTNISSNLTAKVGSKKSSSSSSVHNSNSASSENAASKSSCSSVKTSTGKLVTPVFTIITPDQRLQKMKKKAAAKRGIWQN